jgi:hypothetical protein
MLKKTALTIHGITLATWLPYILGVLGLLIFIFQAFHFAHSTVISMDEGTYLVKGKWFLENKYTPFQEYGPVTNKMPMAFLVPGLSQILFGDGIRSGRYFSILLGVFILLGLWFTVRRVSTLWWATIAVWFIAINPTWIMYYSRAISQAVSSVFMIWSLFFVLGKKRSLWEICAGAFLGSLVVLTRQNLLPYFGLLLIYIVWEYGWKKGLIASLIGVGFFVIVHIAYWPEIFNMIWRPYFPTDIKQMITFLAPMEGIPWPHIINSYSWIDQIQAIAGGLRYSLLPVFIFIVVLLGYPFRHSVAQPTFKSIMFLFICYLSLGLIHLWAVLDNNDFLYSFPAYFLFFNPITLILLPIAYPHLRKRTGVFALSLMVIIIPAITAGIGLHLYRQVSNPLLNLTVPRITQMRLLPGTTHLWQMIYNKFHIDFYSQEYLLPTLAGFIVGVLFLLIGFIAWRLILKSIMNVSYTWFLASSFFIAGFVLTPTVIFSTGTGVVQCNEDIIQAYETVGKELREEIPPGSLVYWESNLSPILLSYIPDVHTFPSQLNRKFYFRMGGDPEILERRNYWNDELARRWLFEADYILLDEEAAKFWEPQLFGVYKGSFDQLKPTSNAVPCQDRTFLRVYKTIE